MKKALFVNLIAIAILLLSGCSAAPTATAEVEATVVEPETLPTEAPVEPTSTEVAPEPTVQLTTAPELPADFSIEGRWDGSLTLAGTSIGTIVYFRTENDVLLATLDIPAQNLFGYALENVSFEDGHVRFEGFAESNRLAVWDGDVQEDGSLSGTFEQLGYKGVFTLLPAPLLAEQSDLPYQTEEVSFQNGEITLGGTLSIPEGEGPFPAMVLISGSGAQNRDEEIYSFKVFGIIADHFTRNGIAVLRYDDRGVGMSTGNLMTSTSADLAGDVLAAVEWLKTRSEIDAEKIGLLGHSEGGIIAPMVAAQSEDVAMIILLAGTAQTGEEIIYQQVELLSRAEGMSEEEVSEAVETQRRYLTALISGEGWEEMKVEMRQEIADQVDALPAAQKASLGDLDAYVDLILNQQVGSMESAWYRFFLTYDPAQTLEQVTTPVLGIFGELDLQVPAETNAPLMEAALQRAGNEDATITIYPLANHLFQEARTGSTTEYAVLKKEFVPGLLDDMAEWILERTASGQ